MTEAAVEGDQSAENALRSFLLSVVVVDDQAAFGKEPDASGAEHPLNAKPLVDAFADRGIVCGVIKPTEDDNNIESRVVNSARRADVVVLDWVLEEDDDGDLAIRIIERLLHDEDSPHKLRHFVIYTGQPDIKSIAKRCKAILEQAASPGKGAVEGSEFTFWQGPITLSVFVKDVVEGPSEDIAARISAPGDLPERIISDYLKRKPGMIESAALCAVAQIRLHTHRLLASFASDVDAGYMWHRVMLEHVDDAPGHVIEMIGAELTDLIDTPGVRDEMSKDAALRWIESNADMLRSKGQFEPEKETSLGELRKVIEHGVAGAKKQNVSLKAFKSLSSAAKSDLPIFAQDKDKMKNSHELFSMLMTLRQTCESNPILQAGVVVETGGEFMLCVQPLCDSVRFAEGKKSKGFPFLKLATLAENSHRFNIVIPGSTQRVHLLISDKPSDLVMIEFATQPFPIRAEENADHLVFRPKDKRKKELVYRATLRPMKSVSVVTILAGQLSRTGINDPEWLRGNS